MAGITRMRGRSRLVRTSTPYEHIMIKPVLPATDGLVLTQIQGAPMVGICHNSGQRDAGVIMSKGCSCKN